MSTPYPVIARSMFPKGLSAIVAAAGSGTIAGPHTIAFPFWIFRFSIFEETKLGNKQKDRWKGWMDGKGVEGKNIGIEIGIDGTEVKWGLVKGVFPIEMLYEGIRRKSKKDSLPSSSAFNPGKGKQKRREKEMIGGEKKGLRIIGKK